jgi:outer membrane protein OmpA-like peptidoglycan-associated protein
LWAVTPDGQVSSIGELPVRNSVTFNGTTPFQSFGLMITAEPYSTVTTPSAAVVAENVASDSNRPPSSTDVNMPAGAESIANESPAGERDYETPLPLLGARRAVEAAGQADAERYASEAWQDVQNRLDSLEQSWAAMKPDRERFVRQFATPARGLMQSAERVRRLSAAAALEARRRAEESTARALDAARRVALQAAVAARDELVRARTEAEAARARADQAQTDAERERARAELADSEAAVSRAEAERVRREAEAARANEAESRQRSERMRAEAEHARTTAQRAEADARDARADAQESEREKDALQRELMKALSEVFETRRHGRGLVCNFSDVWFAFDAPTLTPGGREKLRKLADVLRGHHEAYRVEIEGHTDAYGSDDYNVKLSQERADAVRDELQQAGVDPERIASTRGVGSACPVASNDTREGRQLNRRVEIIISEAGPVNASGACEP